MAEGVVKEACPHCGLIHGEDGVFYCPDKRRWTQQERDELRAQLRRRNPAIQFAPSSAQMQDRFGARNRADALRDRAQPSQEP